MRRARRPDLLGERRSESPAPVGVTEPTVAQGAVGDTSPETTTTLAPEPIERLAVGDSVMLGAAGELAEYGFVVDAEESRGFNDGAEYVAQLAEADLLGDVVVIHLGTNGAINESSMQQMLDTLADVPQVLLVTNDVDRDYTADNNSLIYGAVNARPNVFLLDWQGNARACPAIASTPTGSTYGPRARCTTPGSSPARSASAETVGLCGS